MISSNNNNQGFTLIELLVVVAIIGILVTIVLGSLSKARINARDARRESDMKSIYNALVMYEMDHEFAPTTTSYGGNNTGGWDNSVEGDFLLFLIEGGYMSTVPVDPINNATGTDLSTQSNNTYGYRYYCYPGFGISLGYRKETTNQFINYSQHNGIGPLNGSRDGYFSCGNHS